MTNFHWECKPSGSSGLRGKVTWRMRMENVVKSLKPLIHRLLHSFKVQTGKTTLWFSIDLILETQGTFKNFQGQSPIQNGIIMNF